MEVGWSTVTGPGGRKTNQHNPLAVNHPSVPHGGVRGAMMRGRRANWLRGEDDWGGKGIAVLSDSCHNDNRRNSVLSVPTFHYCPPGPERFGHRSGPCCYHPPLAFAKCPWQAPTLALVIEVISPRSRKTQTPGCAPIDNPETDRVLGRSLGLRPRRFTGCRMGGR